MQSEGRLNPAFSHALIGKYVYLHYLRDRKILSPDKLDRWRIRKADVFGRDATLDGLRAVVEKLDEWLNGHVFPLDLDARNAPKANHVRRVAATFSGDELVGVQQWQLWLDFKRYDFSYIPIETLSVVYEQFLHAPQKDGKPTKGRKVGAYYTPIPVVNLMLSEMEDRRPLQHGMRVLDPSCGSGAFLVQSYRRLIEKEFPAGGKTRPHPIALRELLKGHIFGIDRDPEACNIAELSLILTLLDYVHPPDLENDRRVKLPALRDENIFCGDFFDKDAGWKNKLASTRFDWIVGNPPWVKLNPKKLDARDIPAWEWMTRNRKSRPVGGNQVARAFAWEVAEHVAPGGEVALFLPAMTLFEDPSRKFRAAFFERTRVHAVANFSNLAEVISDGRFRVPAAAFFYRPRNSVDTEDSADETVAIYSPLVANQEPTRPVTEGTRRECWSLVINASEVRVLSSREVAGGSGLPWKLAAWGSHFDLRLLQKLERQFPSFAELEHQGALIASQGLELRRAKRSKEDEEVEYVEEVIGKNILKTNVLKRLRNVFEFPADAVERVDPELCYARKGRSELPLQVCRPPHVIVSAARSFAAYTAEYLLVPAFQIGISSPANDSVFLKALSIYLSSDFAFYHQFLTATQFGVQRGRATLHTLRGIPVPLTKLSRRELKDWTRLHSRLVRTTPRTLSDRPDPQMELPLSDSGDDQLEKLLDKLNALVSDSLGLDSRERALVHDLVHVRFTLNDGKLGRAAVAPPTKPQMRVYARRLKTELDCFIGDQLPKRHDVAVVFDDLSGMIRVDLVKANGRSRKVLVERADHPTAAELERTRRRLREERSQWIYFDRNLRVYEGTRTYILKPMQRFHWTESQAMIDAGEILAETISGSGD